MSGPDERFMAVALMLGRRGAGTVWPNPAVGCVIVRDGRVVGRGWTAPGGRPHAEPRALVQAGQAARGATAYVTLEPCAHTGQTPPCAKALIDAGIARVVIACQDPDPRVNGRGIQMLRDAGISVTTDVMSDVAARDLGGFFSRVTTGRPRVTLKLALSLDGRIATATGESQWITGPAARRHVHGLRARHDAVMVGSGTVRADAPSLTVRDLGVQHQPVRVVMSSDLRLPASGPLFDSAREVPVWLCHGVGAPAVGVRGWTDAGARSIPCATAARGVDPADALRQLGGLGLTSVLCEGGGTLAASLLDADLADEVVVYSAGCAIGGDGRPALAAFGLRALTRAPRFRLCHSEVIGGDLMHRWRRIRD